MSISGDGSGYCVQVLPIRGLIGQLSVEFLIGGDQSLGALAAFVGGQCGHSGGGLAF